MESFELDIKKFSCEAHPQEYIQRFHKDPGAPKSLYCIECLLDSDKIVRASLLDLKNCIEYIHGEFSKQKQIKLDFEPPESLLEIIQNKEDYISKYTEMINEQKALVYEKFKEIKQAFISKIDKSLEQTLLNLEKQTQEFKINLEDFVTKIRKTFKSFSEDEDADQVTRESIFAQINESRSSVELSGKLKSLLNQVSELKNKDSGSTNESTILDNLILHRKSFDQSLQIRPKSHLLYQSKLIELYEMKNSQLNQYFYALTLLNHPFKAFKTNPINSELLNYSDYFKLKEVIFKNQFPKLKFAKRFFPLNENFNLDEINSTVNSSLNTLFIIKTDKDLYLIYKDRTKSNKDTPNSLFGSQNMGFDITYSLGRDKLFEDNAYTYGSIKISNIIQLTVKFTLMNTSQIMFYINGYFSQEPSEEPFVTEYCSEIEVYEQDIS